MTIGEAAVITLFISASVLIIINCFFIKRATIIGKIFKNDI